MDHDLVIAMHRRDIMLAVRRLMGLPSFRPANDSIAFVAVATFDTTTAAALARLCEEMRQDLVMASWPSDLRRRPTFHMAIRETLTVDIVRDVVPWCAGPDEPIALVSERSSELFKIDRRGSMIRLTGIPARLDRGRHRARRRIFELAATIASAGDDGSCAFRPAGGWAVPDAPIDRIIRFV